MIQALYTGATALFNQQRRVDVIANNMANVDTYGYKETRMDFKDALYVQLNNPVRANQENNLLRGNGVLISGTKYNHLAGAQEVTNETFDLAFEGYGYFAVRTITGEVQYTRLGAFSHTPEGWLVTQAGEYVLDENGQPIQIQGNPDNFKIDESGQITEGGGQVYARLMIVDFVNRDGLASAGGNNYRQTEASGEPFIKQSDVTIRQGALETSNVDYALQLSRLIRTQRALQLAGKAVSTADEMEALVNNLRG